MYGFYRFFFLKQFLTKAPARRLGCQPGIGERQIKGHAFFRSIDWPALEGRKITPPYKPMVVSVIVAVSMKWYTQFIIERKIRRFKFRP